ncbi:uncharacterized protein LOC121272359 isoform X2 [Carcharodon carcharias]|uniref:uncharacterized protein LOC121272359 isoform X2 n=1 Tax=Carcharodon carcharias TaxID=13397 RepID=UPI001B7E14AC|nr:uncharacterized protein LOC121272359 isoform X2 [Carcharodon carcharias]
MEHCQPPSKPKLNGFNSNTYNRQPLNRAVQLACNLNIGPSTTELTMRKTTSTMVVTGLWLGLVLKAEGCMFCAFPHKRIRDRFEMLCGKYKELTGATNCTMHTDAELNKFLFGEVIYHRTESLNSAAQLLNTSPVSSTFPPALSTCLQFLFSFKYIPNSPLKAATDSIPTTLSDEVLVNMISEKVHRVLRVIEINQTLTDLPIFWNWLYEVKLPKLTQEGDSTTVINCTTCLEVEVNCWRLKTCWPSE